MYPNNECFLQVLSVGETENNHYDLNSIEFAINNNNSLSGKPALIYGGLLDRCTLNYDSEVKNLNWPKVRNIDGVSYLKLVSNLNTTKGIASAPVRLFSALCSMTSRNAALLCLR